MGADLVLGDDPRISVHYCPSGTIHLAIAEPSIVTSDTVVMPTARGKPHCMVYSHGQGVLG
jgi:hypothetical protein